MKKYIITLVLALGFVVNLNAQSQGNESKSSHDGFFTPNYKSLREGSSVGENPHGDMPRLMGHGSEESQGAPIGSGVLLLAGMGLAYGISRKNR